MRLFDPLRIRAADQCPFCCVNPFLYIKVTLKEVYAILKYFRENLAVKTPNDCVPVYLFNATKLKSKKHNKTIKVSCPSAFYGQSPSVHLLISRLFTAGYFAFFVNAHFHELRHHPAKCIEASKATMPPVNG